MSYVVPFLAIILLVIAAVVLLILLANNNDNNNPDDHSHDPPKDCKKKCNKKDDSEESSSYEEIHNADLEIVELDKSEVDNTINTINVIKNKKIATIPGKAKELGLADVKLAKPSKKKKPCDTSSTDITLDVNDFSSDFSKSEQPKPKRKYVKKKDAWGR